MITQRTIENELKSRGSRLVKITFIVAYFLACQVVDNLDADLC